MSSTGDDNGGFPPQTVSDATCKGVVTFFLLTGAVLQLILAAVSRFEGLRYAQFVLAAGLILTLASYWTLGLEGYSMANYESNTFPDSTPKTYWLQLSGMVLETIAQFIASVWLIFKLQSLSAVSSSLLLRGISLRVITGVLMILGLTTIIGSIVFWTTSYAYFQALWLIVQTLLYLGVATFTFLVLRQSKDKEQRTTVVRRSIFLGSVYLSLVAFFSPFADNDDRTKENLMATLGGAGVSMISLVLVATELFGKMLDKAVASASGKSQEGLQDDDESGNAAEV